MAVEHTQSSIRRMSSSKRREFEKRQNSFGAKLGRCCSAMSKSYSHWAEQTLLGRMITNEWGAVFNLIFSHALFWPTGFIVALDHEYDEEYNDDGGLASGERGSGVFIITCILVIVATLIFIIKMVRGFFTHSADLKRERAAAKEAAAKERSMMEHVKHAQEQRTAAAATTVANPAAAAADKPKKGKKKGKKGKKKGAKKAGAAAAAAAEEGKPTEVAAAAPAPQEASADADAGAADSAAAAESRDAAPVAV